MWPESTIHSYNEDPPETEDSTCSGDAPATPGRRPSAPARDFTATVVPFTDRLRARRGAVPRESDDVPGRPRIKHRSPWTEDHPSPRCVLEDYREGARIFSGDARDDQREGGPGDYKREARLPRLMLRGGYWMIVLAPLTLNMLCSAGHVMTVRPSYFWTVVIVTTLIVLFAH